MRELALDRVEEPHRVGLADERDVREIAGRARGEDDDGDMRQLGVVEEASPQEPAVDARHLQIHDDERYRNSAKEFQSGLAVVRRDYGIALEMEQSNQRVPSLIVVIDDQNGGVRSRVANH